MGVRGPVPKRSDQLRDTTQVGRADRVDVSDLGEEVGRPLPSESWHTAARQLWDSLEQSGQSRFYEPSDWAMAYVLMDDLTHYLRSRSRPGVKLSAILSGLGSLLVTEGDRRRVRLELERKPTDDQLEDPKVAIMEKYRKAAE